MCRKTDIALGLVTGFPAWESAILGYQRDRAYGFGPIINTSAAARDCSKMMDAFDVRPPEPNLGSAKFSGGNQQKLILAREDGAHAQGAAGGPAHARASISARSSSSIGRSSPCATRGPPCCWSRSSSTRSWPSPDRIVVMFQGRIVGETTSDRANERQLGLWMANAHSDGPEAPPSPGPAATPAARACAAQWQTGGSAGGQTRGSAARDEDQAAEMSATTNNSAPGPMPRLARDLRPAGDQPADGADRLRPAGLGDPRESLCGDPGHGGRRLRRSQRHRLHAFTTRPISSSPAWRSPLRSMPACSTSAARVRPISAASAPDWWGWHSTKACRCGPCWLWAWSPPPFSALPGLSSPPTCRPSAAATSSSPPSCSTSSLRR